MQWFKLCKVAKTVRTKNCIEWSVSSGHAPPAILERAHPDSKCHPCPGSSGVEQWIENPRVGGSIPPLGTIYILKSISYVLVDFTKLASNT